MKGTLGVRSVRTVPQAITTTPPVRDVTVIYMVASVHHVIRLALSVSVDSTSSASNAHSKFCYIPYIVII